MDPVWIGIAFIFGLAVRAIGLPPLVGFLFAGFFLNGFDISVSPDLEEISHIGVTLLLFSIGLKLRVRSLASPEVWGGASLHMLITLLLSAAALFWLANVDLQQAFLIGFAMTFSSTVFAVKIFEARGEMSSLHGRVAIGILIMQDLFAVLFLALADGKVPSPWALLLLGLIPLRPVIFRIMSRCGHGELLVLFGLLLGVAGAEAFELVGVKGDLGALILGVMLAKHPQATEPS